MEMRIWFAGFTRSTQEPAKQCAATSWARADNVRLVANHIICPYALPYLRILLSSSIDHEKTNLRAFEIALHHDISF